jgi:NDP-sugar pyrophosphorylase family protein
MALKDTSALVLAAGFGKRLKQLTHTTPKALVRLNGIPMLDITLQKLLQSGFSESRIIVNTHYLAAQVHTHLENHYPRVKVSHEPRILGTGGALIPIRQMLGDDDLLVHNADILCTAPLDDFIKYVRDKQADAGMLVRRDKNARMYGTVLLQNDNTVVDIAQKLFPHKYGEHMFTGIHFLSNALVKKAHHCDFCSVLDNVYYPALMRGARVVGHETDQPWYDIGTPEKLSEAAAFHRLQ